MLSKVAIEVLELTNINIKPSPYQILTSMGRSRKANGLAK
jgi:hypothetical protein